MFLRLFLGCCTTMVCLLHGQFRGSGAGADSGGEISITPRAAKPNTIAVGPPSRHVVRADVKVVLVPVSVTDEGNHPVNDLPKERFRVLEDGVEQQISSFSREDGPVSIGLLFDSSGSMKNRIEASVAALDEVFHTSGPGDEFFLVQFSDDVRQLGGFTTEPEEIRRRLGYVRAGGWTSLLDAVALGINQMKAAKNPRKVLLILSDGNDNNSRFSESEVRSRVMEADVRIYAIGLSYRPRLLARLAEDTGGNVLVAHNMNDLPDVVQRLSAAIRSQYLLGYTPTNQNNDGKYRKLKVELLPPSRDSLLRTSWRRGYYAEGWD